MTELSQSLRLDLADALTGHVELPSHLFEGPGLAVVKTVAEPQDPGFPGCQAGQDLHEQGTLQLVRLFNNQP